MMFLNVVAKLARGAVFIIAVLFYLYGYASDAAFWMAMVAVMILLDISLQKRA